MIVFYNLHIYNNNLDFEIKKHGYSNKK